MKVTIHEAPNMRTWYHANFPDDPIYEQIPAAPFQCLLQSLLGENRHDVYHWCAGDSVIRTRQFAELANRLCCTYGYIYNLWLEDRRARKTSGEIISTQVVL